MNESHTKSAWIETYSGIRFNILDPQPDQIRIEDIAHSLSLLCRFTGHVRYFYSVGLHSLFVSGLVPKRHTLWGLLHDASEIYLGDMNRPMKHHTEAGAAYRQVEKKIMNAIAEKFHLAGEEPELVREADNAMLYAEKQQLMTKLPWDFPFSCLPAPVVIDEMMPKEVEAKFLDRFYSLV